MRCYYDLHIHSALSPCGDNEMTPNNIVNMAIIKGLDIIALTDHNSCGNLRAAAEVAEGRITLIPGMEIETSEEVHIVCYFPTIAAAEAMWKIVQEHLPKVKNKTEIFGNQYYMNSDDEIYAEEEFLLVNATTLDIYEVFEKTKEYGGIAIPAHIDRSSYSIISNLGFIPPDLKLTAVEITAKNLNAMKKEYSKYKIFTNSDAHYLENISEKVNYIDICSKKTEDFFDFLCKKE